MVSPADLFLEKLREYRDPIHDLLGDMPAPLDPSGNALLYESHAAWIVKDYNKLGLHHSHFYNVLQKLTMASGLLNRKPLPAKDPQTHDDYIGAVSVCSAFGLYVYRRGREKGWWYNNLQPNQTFWQGVANVVLGRAPISSLDFWHGRMPGVKQHYMLSAGVDPGKLGWLSWLLSIWWTTRKPGNESGWLLTYLMIRTAEELCPNRKWTEWAASRFLKKLHEFYGGTVQELYVRYFGPNHPLSLTACWPKLPKGCWSDGPAPAACEPGAQEKALPPTRSPIH